MTPCAECGGTVVVTFSDGPVDCGSFLETWECVNCGATGTVHGESSDPPVKWERDGEVWSDR